MKQYNFKIAGWLSIACGLSAFFARPISFGIAITGAMATAYIFICFKRLLNHYGFGTSDKLIICYIVISLIQPLLFFFPQDYLLTIIFGVVAIKGLFVICLGISIFHLKESLFGYKKILGSILMPIGIFYICTGLSLKLTFLIAHIPQDIYRGFVTLASILPIILYLTMGAILLKADKIRYIADGVSESHTGDPNT